MFLPVLLIHRYGLLGFLIFTIPNIIGCTAFGYVVRTPERSKALVAKYKSAMSLFAIVTIAFHLFFIAMLTGTPTHIWIPFAVLFAGGCLAFLPIRWWPILAVFLWLFSVYVGVTLLPLEPITEGEMPWQDAIWLLPITTFGFFLSPYLDPTFHRAIQCSPSKHSFVVFGVSFAIMIGVTCLYQNSILESATMLIGLHLLLQTIFTVGAHIKEGLHIESPNKKWLFVVLGIVGSMIAIGIAYRTQEVTEVSLNDYLRFFVFYGLIFPALVATFMLTGRRFTPIRVSLFVLVALFSLPLLEIGYLGGQAWLTVLPVVVFLTWAFADRKCCDNRDTQGCD